MKNIIIKKCNHFSKTSKVYVHVSSKKIWIKGYGTYIIPVEEGESLYASHQWTGSNIVDYDELNDKVPLIIKPRLNRKFILLVLFVFLLCVFIFIITRFRWSAMPLIPFALYILAYLTVLRNSYLIIEKDHPHPIVKGN